MYLVGFGCTYIIVKVKGILELAGLLCRTSPRVNKASGKDSNVGPMVA